SARGSMIATLTGRTTALTPSLLIAPDFVCVLYKSSNYTSTPWDEFDYLGLQGPALPTANEDGLTIVKRSDFLFLGHVIDTGEELLGDIEQLQDVIQDTVFAHDQWATGTIGSLTTVNRNRNPIVVTPGEVLEYTISDYSYDLLFLDRLYGKIITVAYECEHSLLNIGNRADVEIFDSSNVQIPLLKKEEGLAWFYIDHAISTSLTIRFTNRSTDDITFKWATAVLGWKPALKHDELDWLRKTQGGAIRVEVPDDAISSDYDDEASIRTKGGISSEKTIWAKDVKTDHDILVGRDAGVVRDLVIGRNTAAGGNITL